MTWWRVGQLVVAVTIAQIIVACIKSDARWTEFVAVYLLAMVAILPHWKDPRKNA